MSVLIVQDKKKVVVASHNRDEILSVIPSAKPARENLALLPHTEEVTTVLRNLGYQVPAPILYYYNWPGRFKPMSHQRETAAFLTSHKKCIVLNDMGCVDSDTEYLSPTGWRRISEYTNGSVAQYIPESGAIEFVEPLEFVKKPCTDMVRIKTSRGVDQLLSPEHRVLYVDEQHNRRVASAASVLAAHDKNKTGWRGRIISTFDPPNTSGIGISEAELRLQVAVIADAHFPASTNRCVVRLKKQCKKDRLRTLLRASGTSWKEREQNTATASGFTVFSFVAPIRTKEYGTWAWTATSEQLRIIADECYRWDGSERKAGSVAYFSKSKVSADFIQYAFSASGRTARIFSVVRRGTVEYTVHARCGSNLLCAYGTNNGVKTNTVYAEPSTDGYKYCFMVPSTFLLLRRNGCIFATGNTGKTHASIWAADYLMSLGLVKRVLVVSPLSTMETTWADAIFTTLAHRTYTVLYGTAARRRKLLEANSDFCIINHDGFEIISKEAQGKFDLIIYDEADALRNPSIDRTRTFRRYMDNNPDCRLWLMTGTPTPNEPTDAWSLAKLVGSSGLTSTYTGFRDKVMMKLGKWRMVPRPDSPEVVAKVLTPSIRFDLKDCVDLPEVVYQTRKVELSDEQKKAYKSMLKHLMVEASTGAITAANEAVKAQKLVQIACGVAYDEKGQAVELDCKPRVSELLDCIQQVNGKVIVFVPLTGVIEMLRRNLSKKYNVAVVNGAVSLKQRTTIFDEFQNGKGVDILLAHPQTMSHGLTLTSAKAIIWYGPINSNGQYTQANARTERIGKKHTTMVIHFVATDLEQRMFTRLKNKQKLQGVLLDILGDK